MRIQGQISFRISQPEKTAEVLNYNLTQDGSSYASEDPLKLSDRVVRSAQTLIQAKIQRTAMRDALLISQTLITEVANQLSIHSALQALGIDILDAVSYTHLTLPTILRV